MSNYWTGKLAAQLEPSGITIPPYVTQLKKDAFVAMSGIVNDQVSIEFSRHITLCDFTAVKPFLGSSDSQSIAHEPVFEYIHIAPRDRSYLEIIHFNEDPVEIDFEGDGARAFATARHLNDRASSIDVIAREIKKLHDQNAFTPISQHDLTFHWPQRWAHYVKYFGTKQSR